MGAVVKLKPIRAELSGSEKASACGLVGHGSSPVIALCHELVAAGHDRATPLETYRGETLCLKVRSIGEAADLRVVDNRFQRATEPVIAAPMRLYPLGVSDLADSPSNQSTAGHLHDAS